MTHGLVQNKEAEMFNNPSQNTVSTTLPSSTKVSNENAKKCSKDDAEVSRKGSGGGITRGETIGSWSAQICMNSISFCFKVGWILCMNPCRCLVCACPWVIKVKCLLRSCL